MLELPSGLFINLAQIQYMSPNGDTCTVRFTNEFIEISKEDMEKIKEISNLGMSILNEASKIVI